jgi:glucose/arabinose dehydrogenase
MIAGMWTVATAGMLALVLVTQTVRTAGCSPEPNPSPTPTPTPTPTPAPSGDVYVTSDGVRFRVEAVVGSLVIPWAMQFAPDGRLFVTEREGRVRIVNVAASTSQIALTLPDVFAQGEAGLLGLALDPGFAQNRFVYLYYTATASSGGGVNRIVRYREVGGILGEPMVLVNNIPAAGIHDGGRLRFGPDGLLYASNGDAANTNLPQDLASLAGKFIRLNPDGTSPRDNPFGGLIYSYGHRNPQGFDWHPATGDLWASEHGNIGNDEINVIRAGVNYGWPRIEGAATMAGMEPPITFFAPAIAPSGASFYRGTRFPAFVNNLFAATLRGSHIRRFRIDPLSPRRIAADERLLDGVFGRIRDVVSGPDGYLYFVTNTGTDRVMRIVPAS